jgi:hypothetical protein
MFSYEEDGLQFNDANFASIGHMSADKQFFFNHPLSKIAQAVDVANNINASNTGILENSYT